MVISEEVGVCSVLVCRHNWSCLESVTTSMCVCCFDFKLQSLIVILEAVNRLTKIWGWFKKSYSTSLAWNLYNKLNGK